MTNLKKITKTSLLNKLAVAIMALIILVELCINTVLPLLERFLIIQKPLLHADALVVMAGGESRARVAAAANLYHNGLAKKIILTNDGILGAWSERKNRNLLHVEWMEMELLNSQIPGKAILKLAYSSSGTIYDALMTRTEIVKNRFNRIIIVTSDYHTKRSLWSFEKVLLGLPIEIGVYPAVNDVTKEYKLKKTMQLSREVVKYIYYTIKYNEFIPSFNRS